MDFETRWLEDFIALAATQSFSKSAIHRHVTQPAFSRRIQSLEHAVGVQLVNRSTTPVSLTHEGQLFLVTARNVVAQLRENISLLRGLQDNTQQYLEVAAAHSLALTFFPHWIRTVKDTIGDLTMRLVAMNVEDAMHALRTGQCDLMQVYFDSFATLELNGKTFPSLSLAHTTLLPVCVPDQAGSTQPLYSLDNLETPEIPYLAYGPGAFLGRTVRLLVSNDPLQLRLRIVYETAMAEGLKAMAMNGAGVAWVPRLCIERELSSGELVVCGSARWHAPLEIRLYRCALVRNKAVDQLWRRLQSNSVLIRQELNAAGIPPDAAGSLSDVQ